MHILRRVPRRVAAALGLALAALAGCQTWTSGMTLPSGHYLQHPPQYFPPTPAFPLPRSWPRRKSPTPRPGRAARPPCRCRRRSRRAAPCCRRRFQEVDS